jgi:2-methylcitrate dehydratase PrpD
MAERMDPIERFAEHAAGTTYDRLAPEAVQAVKTFVLDSIGVAMAGSGEPAVPAIVETAARWGEGRHAAVWGSRTRLPAPAAALVNAFQVHCLEFDCVHEGAVVHPMATLLPALLAEVERRGGASGADVIAAVAAGVDVAASLGVAARGPMRFFRPATAGAFGAVAALGNLARLDARHLRHAFGIVYGQISGTLQPHLEGSPLLALQIGFNARAAITAVDLARAGLPGAEGVLLGPYGYLNLYEGGAYDLDPVLADLGRVRRITEVAHKPFPSGRLTHGVVDGLQRLAAAHGFSGADVARVIVAVPPLVMRLVGRADMDEPSAAHARLCLPFVAAIALLRGTVDVPDFRGERLADHAVHQMAKRVEIVADGNPDENALVPQSVTVELAGGGRHAVHLDQVLGHPARPLSRERHLEKFRRNWRYGATPPGPAAAEALIGAVDRLETLADARELIALTVP